MARLNTHPSATPQPIAGRSSTVDSLYRDPTPRGSQRASRSSHARASTYSVMSPSTNSDKENEQPESRDITPQPPSKTRRVMGAPSARLPTPQSGSSTGNSNKRRRTNDYSAASSAAIYEDHDAQQEEDVENEEQEDEIDASAMSDDTGDKLTEFYDPQQDPDIRREVRSRIQNNHRDIDDNRDTLVQPGDKGLLPLLKKADHLMRKVKRTDDATLDAQFMLAGTDIADKKLNNTLKGNGEVGIDVDQFVSRCILFMRSGGDPEASMSRSTQARRATEEDEDEMEEGLDWAFLGREACFPFNNRPPTASFLLGPLSVQKRARAAQTRRARSQRQPTGPATRPQEVNQEDIQQSENNNVRHIVSKMKDRLKQHIIQNENQVTAELEEMEEDPTDEDFDAACRRHRICQTTDKDAGVSLFDFVINPQSFGQTVENLFYTSFLIKESQAKVAEDAQGLPVLVPADAYTLEQQRDRGIQKHQAVFSLDYSTWKKLIKAFDIKEPLIPHRAPEESNVAAGGWYG